MTFSDILFDADVFPEPDKFDPSRWLDTAEHGDRLERYQVGFGKGSRMCVGMNLAYAEVYFVVAVILYRFDLELYDFQYERDLKTVRDAFISLPSKESKGVTVKLRERQ